MGWQGTAFWSFEMLTRHTCCQPFHRYQPVYTNRHQPYRYQTTGNRHQARDSASPHTAPHHTPERKRGAARSIYIRRRLRPATTHAVRARTDSPYTQPHTHTSPRTHRSHRPPKAQTHFADNTALVPGQGLGITAFPATAFRQATSTRCQHTALGHVCWQNADSTGTIAMCQHAGLLPRGNAREE